MKVAQSVRSLYNAKIENYERLKELVDNKIDVILDDKWHYESRIKELESFAQKLETGRFCEMTIFHDVFAGRIVVENILEIHNLKTLLKKHFEFVESKPPSSKKTMKEPSDFQFDDLRLYFKWPYKGMRAEEELVKDLVFEIQVKTFLQHAWSIATHSLIYKGNDVNWTLHRVAFQIKAMLEHAEMSIGEAKNLAESKLLPIENPRFKKYAQIQELLEKYWYEEQLPTDRTRLVTNLETLLKEINMKVQEYKELLNKSIDGKGKLTITNLSPYYATIQLLKEYEPSVFQRLQESDKYKLYYIEEIE